MLTVAELAAYLGVSPSAVQKAVKRHHIQHAPRRKGHAYIYDAKTVLKAMGRHDRLLGLARYVDHQS